MRSLSRSMSTAHISPISNRMHNPRPITPPSRAWCAHSAQNAQFATLKGPECKPDDRTRPDTTLTIASNVTRVWLLWLYGLRVLKLISRALAMACWPLSSARQLIGRVIIAVIIVRRCRFSKKGRGGKWRCGEYQIQELKFEWSENYGWGGNDVPIACLIIEYKNTSDKVVATQRPPRSEPREMVDG